MMKSLHIGKLLQIKQAVRLVWRSSIKLTISNALLVILQGLLPLAGLYLMKLLVDEVSAGITASDKEAAFGRVMFLIALAGGVVLFTALFNTLAGLVRQAQSQVVSDYMHDILHAKSIELDLEYYENSQYYDTLHRTKQEALFRPARIVNGVVEVGQNSISLLAMVGLLFAFHWAIPLILLFATLPGAWMRLHSAKRMHEWQVRRTSLERRGGYFHHLLLDELHAKEIRLFNLGSLLMNRFHDVRRQLRKERLKIVTRQSAGELVSLAGGTLAVFGCYAYIAYHSLHGWLSLGALVMYMGAFQRGQTFLQELFRGTVGLYEDNLFLTSLYKFLDLKQKVVEPLHPRLVPSPMRKGIRLEQVSFRYQNSPQTVLDNISMEIRAGEIIGLVGENGSGKTTLIKLLCRFYDPTAGKITLDGIDLREFNSSDLRSQISVVFQDYRRYYTTVRENIWFGDIERSPDDERITTAAKYSDLHPVIWGFERKYDTALGKWLENGEELSIGQMQKLAVSRGLFRDAPLMILDEPTSAMDAKSEFELYRRFQEMARGRTIVLISHRLSTLKMADRIYVMKEGRTIESGSHDDLVGLGGTYSFLFETQARAYR